MERERKGEGKFNVLEHLGEDLAKERWDSRKWTNGGDATCCVEVPSYGHLDRLHVLLKSQSLNVFKAGGFGPVFSINDRYLKTLKIMFDDRKELRLGLSSGGHH